MTTQQGSRQIPIKGFKYGKSCDPSQSQQWPRTRQSSSSNVCPAFNVNDWFDRVLEHPDTLDDFLGNLSIHPLLSEIAQNVFGFPTVRERPISGMRSLSHETRLNTFNPVCDVYTQNGNTIIECEVPGIPENMLKVEITGSKDCCTISGQKCFRPCSPEECGGEMSKSQKCKEGGGGREGMKEQGKEGEQIACWKAMERNFGSFTRCFKLPHEVEPDRVNCNLSNGVLTVCLPCPEELLPYSVPISSSTLSGSQFGGTRGGMQSESSSHFKGQGMTEGGNGGKGQGMSEGTKGQGMSEGTKGQGMSEGTKGQGMYEGTKGHGLEKGQGMAEGGVTKGHGVSEGGKSYEAALKGHEGNKGQHGNEGKGHGADVKGYQDVPPPVKPHGQSEPRK